MTYLITLKRALKQRDEIVRRWFKKEVQQGRLYLLTSFGFAKLCFVSLWMKAENPWMGT